MDNQKHTVAHNVLLVIQLNACSGLDMRLRGEHDTFI